MTLHAIVHNISSTYWWYAAIPNERRGRIHLLKVPALYVDQARLYIPTWMSQDSADRYRIAYAEIPLIVPDTVYAANQDHIRACTTRQEAYKWGMESDQQYVTFGICASCVAFGNEHREQIGVPNQMHWAPTGSRIAKGSHALTQDTGQWRVNVERSIYSGL